MPVILSRPANLVFPIQLQLIELALIPVSLSALEIDSYTLFVLKQITDFRFLFLVDLLFFRCSLFGVVIAHPC